METLRVKRMQAGISQKQLSELAGLTTVTVNCIEKGKRYPNDDTRQRIESIVGEVNWMSTRLQGTVSMAHGENDSPEDKVIKVIYEYINSSAQQSEQKRFDFLKEYIARFERKKNFMDKVHKVNRGEVDLSIFTKSEMNMINTELPAEILRRTK